MRNYFLLLCCFMFSITTFAQSSIPVPPGFSEETNIDFKNQMNNIFGTLEKNRVPHAILLDYGMEFTNVPAYNGVLTDSTYADMGTMKLIYKTLLTSRILDVSTGFITPDEYDLRWKNNRSASYVSVGGLYYKYSQIYDNAVSTSKITVSSNKAYDKYVGGVWQNPYQELQTFVMTPAIKKYTGLSLTVKIPSAIFYSNYNNLIQSIQIDFDNGAGYVTVSLDQNLGINYSVEGVKNWKYKLNLTNGTSLYSQSRIKIEKGFEEIPY